MSAAVDLQLPDPDDEEAKKRAAQAQQASPSGGDNPLKMRPEVEDEIKKSGVARDLLNALGTH